jgi:energy-coupling factor transporter ATP-binding protein EcfA2
MSRLLKVAWHEAFHACASPHTPAPDNFLTWGALSLIGAVLKDNVYFEDGTYNLYPNQFIVLISPPGIGKGTTMDLISSLIEESAPNYLVNTLSDRVTAEKIIELIANGWNTAPVIANQQLVVGKKDHSCIIDSSELRVLLSASDWMLEFLCEAWSKKTYSAQTKNKGSAFIKDMCVSLIAATVPDYMRSMNRDNALTILGGFTSRCLFIYAENPSKDLPWPTPLKKNTVSKKLYDELSIDLRSISSLRGEFKVDTSARLMFETFLKKYRVNSSLDDSEAVANFKARIRAHALKLAMVMSVSRGDTLTINAIDMANTITELEKVLLTLEKIFRGVGDSPDAAATARVRTLLETHGMLTRREMLKHTNRHMSYETLDRILYVMEQIGYVLKIRRGNDEFFKMIVKKNP